MKKFTRSTLVALLFLSVTSQAQVKETYKKNEMTTVVVKEDAANDMDILNGQFDLDDVGMHQVIRITTRKEAAPETATKQATSNDQVVTEVKQETTTSATLQESVMTASIENIPELVLEQPETVQVKTIAESKAQESIEETVSAVSPVIETTSSERSTSTTSRGYTAKRKSSKHTFATFNKRFKKQKRKRVPRKGKRNKRCYRF